MLNSKIPLFRVTLYSLLFFATFIFWGCSTRSISNSGYETEGYYQPSDNPFYKGELTEFDVLGIDPAVAISDEEITKALSKSSKVSIKKGDSIMLIQSGAMFPDEPMQKEFDRHFATMPFSGVPMGGSKNSESNTSDYGKALRLAAAKGGNEVIICYWGILETAQRNLATKALYWMPVVGMVGLMVPDESQMMRIRLKFAIIDVASGSWSMFSPEPIDDKTISAVFNRESSDQDQVALLKEKAYKDAVEKLIHGYSRIEDRAQVH
jgi:hypothetical protein